MAQKVIQVDGLYLRHDSYANWTAESNPPILQEGEIGIVIDDSEHNGEMRVGKAGGTTWINSILLNSNTADTSTFMSKAVYDTDKDGIVDNANALQGYPASEFLRYKLTGNPTGISSAPVNADTLGGKPESELSVQDSSRFNGHTFQELIDIIYPIGSIYMSLNRRITPNTLFGGTWELISAGTFLAAATSRPISSSSDDYTYNVNDTGGERTHTLTVDEMPRHAHDTPFFNNMTNNGEGKADYIGVYGKGQTASQALQETGESQTMEMWWASQTNPADGPEWSYLTSSKGGSQPHNNIPPYLAVLMWKRTG